MDISAYIGEYKLDLHKDEKIQISQKVVDLENLSKLFTDYTNSFSIPATQHNNKIMNHFYDGDINRTFNLNKKIGGLIEVDTLPFKFGEWLLESCEMENNKPKNYKITFFGKTTQLTTLFGNDTIGNLDYLKDVDPNSGSYLTTEIKPTGTALSRFNYTYNYNNFYKTLKDVTFGPTGSQGSIITPIISYSNRDWNWGSFDTTDISLTSSAILDDELKPAIKCIRIIEGIEQKYGLSFSRDFLSTKQFDDLYLWLNKGSKVATIESVVDLNTSSFYTGDPLSPTPVATPTGVSFNLTDNTITTSSLIYGAGVSIIPYTTSMDKPYSIKVEIDGVIGFEFTDLIGVTPFQIFPLSVGKNVRLYVQSNDVFQFIPYILIEENIGDPIVYSFQASQLIVPIVQVPLIVPDMKVIDFIQGIMKMFKLVIRPISKVKFYLDTLDNYYSNGSILDITKYVDVNKITVSRPDIYDKLIFKYIKSDNVLNKKFRNTFDPIDDLISYGDAKTTFPSISNNKELKIEVPFENMMWERPSISKPNSRVGELTDILWSQAQKLGDDQTTLTPNDCKPILFYNNGTYSISNSKVYFTFTDTAPVLVDTLYYCSTFLYSSPIVSGTTMSNTNYENIIGSLNFNNEIDPYSYKDIGTSLLSGYWNNWLSTIYDRIQRKYLLECILPPRYITEISLNDSLIIGQNRYRINDFKIDLTTGKTSLNLFRYII